jgi:hypothetical protein
VDVGHGHVLDIRQIQSEPDQCPAFIESEDGLTGCFALRPRGGTGQTGHEGWFYLQGLIRWCLGNLEVQPLVRGIRSHGILLAATNHGHRKYGQTQCESSRDRRQSTLFHLLLPPWFRGNEGKAVKRLARARAPEVLVPATVFI